MILSPYFVLRLELGEGTTGRLTPYEVAERLSHFATRRAPDDTLRALAAAGGLTDPAVLSAELHRLWSLPEGQAARARQHLEWLGLDEQSQSMDLDPELRADMLAQSAAFVNDVLSNQSGTLRDLLASPRQPLTERLANHYGVPAPDGAGLTFVDLDPTLFSGLLSQGLFLTRYPRPTLRGREIVQSLLCTAVPDQPASLVATFGPGTTPRERITQGTITNVACKGCHDLIDPVGFALEAFDEQGRLTGFDTAGFVPPFGGGLAPLPVTGPGDLGSAIARSDLGRTCAARQYLGYALDRELTGASSNVSNGAPPPAPAPAPVPLPQLPQDPALLWTSCLLQLSGSGELNLNQAAEQIVTSTAFLMRATIPKRVVAFDTSLDPLGHAIEETAQFRGVFPDQVDEQTIQRYLDALKQLQVLDALQPGGEGGAGGDASAAGASGSGTTGGAENAGGAP
jgi:hypothetical protein